MYSCARIPAFAAFLAAVAPYALADQTACANSISFPDYQSSVNYPPSDGTTFTVNIAFDGSACGPYGFNSQLQDPRYRAGDATAFFATCDSGGFDPTGVSEIMCRTVTRGNMDGTHAYEFEIDIIDLSTESGISVPVYKDFSVTHAAAPEASQGMIRRRRLEASGVVVPRAVQDSCPSQHTLCQTGTSAAPAWLCLDTQTDLSNCGGCAGAGGVDCSAIDSALTVRCEASKCIVDVCDDSSFPSPDKSKCVPFFQ